MTQLRTVLPAVLAAPLLALATPPLALAGTCPSAADLKPLCPRVITADVVALDQPYFYNRLGTSQPNGEIFALRSDVVPVPGALTGELEPGHVMLRPDKRPRPMVLRVPEGECLRIDFENLLAPDADGSANESHFEDRYGVAALPQTATRNAGVHVTGLPLVAACAGDEERPAIDADASFVGTSPDSLAAPGERRTYVYRAEQEGAYMLASIGAAFGLIDGNGQMALGLHGMVNVEPPGAVFFRSQVTREDLLAANRRGHDCPFDLTDTEDGPLCLTPHGQPVLDYWARYRDRRPILAMLDRPDGYERRLTATDVTALVAFQGPDRGQPGPFPYDPANPLCFPVPAETGDHPVEERCTRPFREITTLYEEPLAAAVQSLACLTANSNNAVGEKGAWMTNGGITSIVLSEDLAAGAGIVTASQTPCPPAWNVTPFLKDVFSTQGSLDSFAINYGMDGIGPRVLANRLRVGPAADCVACRYEEFFLSSWPNGDPAQVSTRPAGLGPEDAATGAAKEAIRFPDDPSSVYHSYLGDPVKFRIGSAGATAAHVHHQHAHQWLHTPNASAGHYLDSQTLTPGATYTLQMVYNGSGNRNETVGDSIFHCHFYPHFASGMWSLWRVHDVYETGTRMDPATGRPASAWTCGDDRNAHCRVTAPNRALPDATIAEGSPIPAVVPLPVLAMPPMPAAVALSRDGKRGLTLVPERGGGWRVLESAPATAAEAAAIGNPGYPFFIPGVAGQRAVRPPLDVAEIGPDGERQRLDGGLPRHLISGRPHVAEVTDPAGVDGCTPDADDNTYRECHTRLDFTKTLLEVDAAELDEDGEPAEQVAMWWHGTLFPGGRVPSCDSEGRCDEHIAFRLNGSPPVSGAPYADPCAREDRWNGETRHYKAAAIQTDVAFTKEGWHFPQQRILTLWDDVAPTLAGERPPEPLFFRANSGECIDFWHANLVPSTYALDDYQVRTPTDVIGQHIHLVKFDVTSSDGAANGFNYEDATLSPDEVRERIAAINAGGGLAVGAGAVCPDGEKANADGRCTLAARPLPFFGPGPGGRWIGAMATVQRWMADPLEDAYGTDRTLRTVFTHDHLSPSTHQQAGLYAGLLVEPKCSKWVDSWTGEVMGGSLHPREKDCEKVYAGRPFDGGPTSWRANVLWDEGGRLAGVREFALEFQDLALAYAPDTTFTPNTLGVQEICPTCPGPSEGAGIGPSSISNKFNYGVDFPRVENSPGIESPVAPFPQAVTFGAMFGAYSINYRSEPLAPRVTGADGSPPPATGARPANRDYAQVYRSIERENPALDTQPAWYPPLTGGMEGRDPMTPLLEAYAGDRVQIRTLTGAHFLNHQFTLRGLPWLFEPSLANSGYRAAQTTSISEHFEMNVQLPAEQGAPRVDVLYQTDTNTQAQGKGGWGLLRAYGERQSFLEPLPDNVPPERYETPGDGSGRRVCGPASLNGEQGFTTRRYRVLALDAHSFADGTPLPYRSPVDLVLKGEASPLATALESPEALVYVLADDVEQTRDGRWRFRPGRVHEPLVLRAAAGDCLEVVLENRLDPLAPPFVTDNPTDQASSDPDAGSSECTDARYLERLRQVRSGSDPGALDGYAELCGGSFAASTRVGLNPQLVTYDPLAGAGYDAGVNPVRTAAPGETRTVYWYAGHVETGEDGARTYTPVEFGAANLLPADPLFQHPKGLFGALVVEPRGARWVEDANTRLQATVVSAGGETFREGVLFFQDDLELYFRDRAGRYQAVNVQNLANFPGQTTAVGYGSEPPVLRMSPPAPYDVKPADGRGGAPAPYGNLLDPDFVDQTCWLSSAQVGRDPSTTLLVAHAGTPYRLRLLHPLGNFTPQTFVLHGHGWQEEPYVPLDGAANTGGFAGPGLVPQRIGHNPASQRLGSQGGFGSAEHFDVVLDSAGGPDRVPGDYLYRSAQSNGFGSGSWGLFRVGPEVPEGEKRDVLTVIRALSSDGSTTVVGDDTSILGSAPGERRFARRLSIHAGRAADGTCPGELLAALDLQPPAGPVLSWTWTGRIDAEAVCVQSDAGGIDGALVTSALPCPPASAPSQADLSRETPRMGGQN